jgi:hypothetical protein
LALLADVPVMAEPERQQRNRADRAAADGARRQAGWHREEAERVRAGRHELIEATAAEFLVARDDAQIIEAGPGRLGRRADRVEAARERRENTARRWPHSELPGVGWADQMVRGEAVAAAERVVAAGVGYHHGEAGRYDQTATDADRHVTLRDHQQRDGVSANRQRAGLRQALVEAAEHQRVRVVHNTAVRAARTATMSPGQIDAADTAREGLTEQFARQQQVTGQQEQARQARMVEEQQQAMREHARHLQQQPRGPEIGHGY